ncbi:hypothetical protein B1729_09500 [Microbacterium sp. B35-04]|uniref:(2Fe-2S)-binding protein n=1 Tax=unclassified Microbacterium TaxID=2609290 RepID=UPI0013D15827|nr:MULTISPECIES: (2Fe-2S)-binding protein [unclassified Microbacterium]KAF2413520.1 hypothetical protein B1729_09500 [Microbacterium sp. B35-04]KAF2417774.1 hypothetical protein B2K11_10285 [Microbacterium sp. B35-30]
MNAPKPDRTGELTFDGRSIAFREGQTIGAALAAAGVSAWRTTRVTGEPRGLFCGIGVCYDCILTVDGARARRACVTPARDGQVVRSDDPHEALPMAGGHGG